MRDVKSLAAEIEAVLRRHHLGKSRVVFGESGQPIDRVAEAAAEIAANQSRAFEDGARGLFRSGRRVPRNVYRGDVPLFMAATAQQAAELVALLNAGASALQPEGEQSDA